MKNIDNILISVVLGILLGMLPVGVWAAKQKSNTDLRIVDISRVGTEVRVVYDLPLERPQADYQVTLQPAICGSHDTVWLDEIVLNGWNNIRQLHRDHVLNHKDEPEQDYYPQRLRVNQLRDTVVFPVADYIWLLRDTICLCRIGQVKEGCCRIRRQDDQCSSPYYPYRERWSELPPVLQGGLTTVPPRRVKPLTVTAISNSKVLVPIEHYTPYMKTEVLSEREDVLYVHYALDSTALRRSFRNNAAVLDSIVKLVNLMQTDTMAQVRVIQVVGLASVEGRVEHNDTLAGARAEALKDYIQQHTGVPDSLFEVANGGEAWSELGWQVAQSDFVGKNQTQRIIGDTTLTLEKKEELIKKLNRGQTYEWIRKNLLQDQRNAGYIRVFYDLKTDSAALAINAAVEQILLYNFDEALLLLMPYKDDPRAWNALGVALYMTGREDEAEQYWNRSDE